MSEAPTADPVPRPAPAKIGFVTNAIVTVVFAGIIYLVFNQATRWPTLLVLGVFFAIVFTPLGKPVVMVLVFPFVFLRLYPKIMRDGGLLDHARLTPFQSFERWTPELAARFDAACAEVEATGFRSLGRHLLSSIEIPVSDDARTQTVMQLFLDRTETVSCVVCTHVMLNTERAPEVLVELVCAKSEDRHFEVLRGSVAPMGPTPPSRSLVAPPGTPIPRLVGALGRLVSSDDSPAKLIKQVANGLDHYATLVARETAGRYVNRGVVRRDAALPGTYRYTARGLGRVIWATLPFVQRSRVARRHREFEQFRAGVDSDNRRTVR